MRVPLSWIAEFVEIGDITADYIAETLSLRSVETEVNTFGIELEGVVAGRVLKVDSHPKDKNLLVVKVEVGKETVLTVVTADLSVEEGKRVIVALPNSKVGNRCVTKREIKGVLSEGILLSPQELGIEDSGEGVLKFDDDVKPGTDARDVLGFGEIVLELDITPNRGDVLSVRGLARDISAILSLKKKRVSHPELEERGDLRIRIEDDDCRRYRGVVIEGVEVRESPLWMRRRLWQCGLKSINNVVDVTNYILLQEGQPLHAFDLDTLEGGVVVRKARKGERIRTLDGEERELDEDILIISDEKKPIAIAGVIGGLDTSVRNSTKRVLLEAAYFEPRRVRISSKRLGIQTESSYRFERNVDIENVERAENIAATLILETAGGEILAVKDVYPKRYEPKRVFLPMGKFARYTGEYYRREDVERILSALEIPFEMKKCGIEVLVPSHRSFDIERDVDIIEEIMRVDGYDRYTSETLNLPSLGKLWRDENLEIRKFLKSKGLREVINISYEDLELYRILGLEEPKVEILNPLVPTQRFMRSSLLPSLLRTAMFNENHYNYDIAIFELGRVFLPEREEDKLGILVKGKVRDFPSEEWNPYRLMEIVQGLAGIYGRELSFERSSHAFLHPHTQTDIFLEGENVGFLGKLHPKLADELEFKRDTYLCEIKVETLIRRKLPHYSPVSKFPPVIRDLALSVDKNLAVSKLINEIKSQLKEKVEEVMVFDLYAGEKVGEGKKSVGVRLVFRSLSGSLSSEEVSSLLDELVRRLRERLGVEMR